MPPFQDLILTLQRYWAEQGCVLLQPDDMEVGAGTFHTATFLRALGPEPWNAADVQPTGRPTDGRDGDNPFRLQHYYQYQVVIKPSPRRHHRAGTSVRSRGGLDPLRARRPAGRGQLGVADARRLGTRLGGVAERHGSHAVHLLPAGGRPRLPPGHGRDHLRPRAPRDVPAGRRERLYLVWTDGPHGRVTYGDVYHQNEVEQSQVQLRARRHRLAVRRVRPAEKKCKALLEAACRCRPTSRP